MFTARVFRFVEGIVSLIMALKKSTGKRTKLDPIFKP
jgi:hypothetical protein